MSSLLDFTARRIDGQSWDLKDLQGRVVLVVNTASACGFTPQLAGLEKLYQTYGGRGLSVLGFPCNQFGGQDPKPEDQILSFCQKNYGVSFAMMGKVDVNGPGAHPLFQWLTRSAPGVLGTQAIKWNFTKFLIGKDGQVIRRYGSMDKPESLSADIEAALAA